MTGVFDNALDKRFSESPELTLTNVDGVDVLLIRNAADGSAYRIQASTLASFINSAIAQADILDALNAPNGVATLDSGGKVPAAQLPATVDDVLEYATASAFPATGEAGKIYVALDTNLTYRWGGYAYVEISQSLALGETASTAYRGDRGKTAYDHSQTSGNPHGTSKADVGLGNVTNDAQLKAASNLSDLPNAGTARTNLGLGTMATQNATDVTVEKLTVSGTGGLKLPTGTTAERPTGASGLVRMNSTTKRPEWYDTETSTWIPFNAVEYEIEYFILGGGGGGGGSSRRGGHLQYRRWGWGWLQNRNSQGFLKSDLFSHCG